MRALVVFGGESRPSEIRILNRTFAEWFFKKTKCHKIQWSNLFEKIAKFQKIHKKYKKTEKPKKFTKFQKNQKDDNSSLNTSVMYKLFRVPNATGPLIIFTIQDLRTSNLLFAEQFRFQFKSTSCDDEIHDFALKYSNTFHEAQIPSPHHHD